MPSVSMATYSTSLYRFVHDLPDSFLDLPDAPFGRLFDVTHGLIRLALGAESVVPGQPPRRLLDAPLHYLWMSPRIRPPSTNPPKPKDPPRPPKPSAPEGY